MNDYVLTLKFMKSLINKDGVNDFVDKINQLINEKQIDVLIFDIKDTLVCNMNVYEYLFLLTQICSQPW